MQSIKRELSIAYDEISLEEAVVSSLLEVYLDARKHLDLESLG